MKKAILDEKEVIEYFKTHTLSNTCGYFKTKHKRILEILSKHGIKDHTPEERWKLRGEVSKKTNLDKYGCEWPTQNNDVLQKRKDNYFEKTGYEYPMQNPEVRKLSEDTCLKKYGFKNVMGSEEIKNIMFLNYKERTGYDYPSQNPDVLQKRKDNYFEKTGYNHPMNNPEVLKKMKNNYFEKTGYEYPMQNPDVLSKFDFKEWRNKINNTMRKNNTFKGSKLEDNVYNDLVYLFGADDIIRQYKDERYPFLCDFYIRSKDLFIELNNHWTHNDHLYNSSNIKDLITVGRWKHRHTKYYDNAINTWTNLDKTKFSYINKLNHIWAYTANDIYEALERRYA